MRLFIYLITVCLSVCLFVIEGMIRYTDTETDAGSEYIGEGEWDSMKEVPDIQSNTLQDV